MAAFRVKLSADDLNCIEVPLNPTHSLTSSLQFQTEAGQSVRPRRLRQQCAPISHTQKCLYHISQSNMNEWMQPSESGGVRLFPSDYYPSLASSEFTKKPHRDVNAADLYGIFCALQMFVLLQ